MTEMARSDTRKQLMQAIGKSTYAAYLTSCGIDADVQGKYAAQISCIKCRKPVTRKWENCIRTELLGMNPIGRRKRWRPAVPIEMRAEFRNYAEVIKALQQYLDNQKV